MLLFKDFARLGTCHHGERL